MDKQFKYTLLFDDDAIYAEAQRRIQECREKKRRKLFFAPLKLKTLPPEIAELETLVELDLSNLNLKEIPGCIGSINALKKLSLGWQFSGLSDREKVILPAEFGNLHNLRHLTLGYDIVEIPQWVWSLEKLETLIICNDAIKTIPAAIGNLRKLKHLSICGTCLTKIPDSISRCPLTYLELHGNYQTLPETFGYLSVLNTLKLYSNKSISLPDSFGKLTALEELSLMAQNTVLPRSFGSLSSLKRLFIQVSGLQTIPASIGGCKNLELFSLESDALSVLPPSLCELKKLEELRLDTFALKSLPGNFGSLVSLKTVDIFSGALTVLPESMGNLKNINNLNLDLYNLIKLPGWLRKLSNSPDIHVKTNKEYLMLPLSSTGSKKKSIPGFDDIAAMSYHYRWKILETFSLKEIESILCSATSRTLASEETRDVFRTLMLERRCRLNRKFKWTDENKQRAVRVSDAFLAAWEDGFARAKTMVTALYKKDIASFKTGKIYIEITLYPEILIDSEKSRDQIYLVITDYLNPPFELNIKFDYNSETADESGFRDNIHIRRNLSWNIEGFGDLELRDYYICYALHILYSHNEWANEDVLKINNIVTEVKITCDNDEVF